VTATVCEAGSVNACVADSDGLEAVAVLNDCQEDKFWLKEVIVWLPVEYAVTLKFAQALAVSLATYKRKEFVGGATERMNVFIPELVSRPLAGCAMAMTATDPE
jgi:hypothetical protein